LRELGPHPKGGAVPLYRGRYGPYVSHNGVIASLPKGADPDSFALAAAVELLAAQRAKGKGRRPVRKAALAAAPNGAAKPAGKRKAAAKRTASATKAKPKAKSRAKSTAKPARRPSA